MGPTPVFLLSKHITSTQRVCVTWVLDTYLFNIPLGLCETFFFPPPIIISWSSLLQNYLTKPNFTAVTNSPSLHLLPSWLHLMSTHSARRCSVDKENSSGGPVCEICDILQTTTALITGCGWLKGRGEKKKYFICPDSCYERVFFYNQQKLNTKIALIYNHSVITWIDLQIIKALFK